MEKGIRGVSKADSVGEKRRCLSHTAQLVWWKAKRLSEAFSLHVYLPFQQSTMTIL